MNQIPMDNSAAPLVTSANTMLANQVRTMRQHLPSPGVGQVEFLLKGFIRMLVIFCGIRIFNTID